MTISHAWSGCIDGWCAVQVSASGMCECAVGEVCVSLQSGLSSAAANFLLIRLLDPNSGHPKSGNIQNLTFHGSGFGLNF